MRGLRSSERSGNRESWQDQLSRGGKTCSSQSSIHRRNSVLHNYAKKGLSIPSPPYKRGGSGGEERPRRAQANEDKLKANLSRNIAGVGGGEEEAQTNQAEK